jgi:hypothetical protein
MTTLELGTTLFNDGAICPKRYDYHANLKLVPKARNIRRPLRRGIWVHSCLEHASKGGLWEDRLAQLVDWANEHDIPEEDYEPIHQETMDIMMGYSAYWSRFPHLKPEPIIAEQALTAYIKSLDVTLSATVDLLAKYKGHTVLWEYKSTMHIPPANWRAIDPQTAIQYIVAKANGIQIDGIVFDYLLTQPPPIPQVLKDGTISKRAITTTSVIFDRTAQGLDILPKASAPERDEYLAAQRVRLVSDEKFYQRYEVFRPESYIKETAKDIAGVVAHLRLCQERGHWPRAFHPVMCTRMCQYSELCSLEYMSGKPSLMREEEFDLDDGTREGRFDPLTSSLLSSSGEEEAPW